MAMPSTRPILAVTAVDLRVLLKGGPPEGACCNLSRTFLGPDSGATLHGAAAAYEWLTSLGSSVGCVPLAAATALSRCRADAGWAAFRGTPPPLPLPLLPWA